MVLQKLTKTELIRGMHDLSLKNNEVYLLETVIKPLKIEHGTKNSEPVQISVPAGRLSLPLAYAHVTLDPKPEVVMWSYFLDKFARGEKVPDEWEDDRLSGFHTDWDAYLRSCIGPTTQDIELWLFPYKLSASLTNCHKVFEESDGMSREQITSAVNELIGRYFVVRDKFEKKEVSKTYLDFKPDKKFWPQDAEKQEYLLGKLKMFHDQIKDNVMSYFIPK